MLQSDAGLEAIEGSVLLNTDLNIVSLPYRPLLLRDIPSSRGQPAAPITMGLPTFCCKFRMSPSKTPPSLCEGSWSHTLSNCELTWSDVAAMDLRSIMNCGLLQSSQLYPLCCTFRVRDEEISEPAYTCRMYFLQQDQRLETVIAELKGLSWSLLTFYPIKWMYRCGLRMSWFSESSSSQKTASDSSRTGISSLFNSGQNNRGGNLGVAGPPGGFPLMVAAETLAASFGVHMNRSQTGSLDPVSTKSRISLKKSSSGASKSGASSTSIQSSPHDSSSPKLDVGSSHHKSSLLRSTFARMRQVAMGGAQVNPSISPPSAITTAPTTSSILLVDTSTAATTTTTYTSSRSAFHQRLTHFSQTFTHDKSSPRRRKLDQIHRSYQSCQSPHPSDVNVDSEAPLRKVEPRDKKYAQLHLPLTAVLEPSNSFIQSIGDEVLVNGGVHQLVGNSRPGAVPGEEAAITSANASPVSNALSQSSGMKQPLSSPKSGENTPLWYLIIVSSSCKNTPNAQELSCVPRWIGRCYLPAIMYTVDVVRSLDDHILSMTKPFEVESTPASEPKTILPNFIALDLGAANELAVTMPMQLAVVDAAMVAASGGTSTSVEAARAGVEGGVRADDTDDHTATMQQSHLPVEHSTGKGLEPAAATRSISVTSGIMNTSHSQKELNAQTARRLLRRPTDPAMSIDSEPGDLHEAVLLDPPILHPERSLVGSLPIHQCARSTFSAFVPFVVELCVTLVEKFGLNCVGIYRVSGNKLAHDFMAAELCKQLGEIDASNEKWNDIHALACVLKTLLRNLPDSLIPKVSATDPCFAISAMYPEFLAASRVESWERRLLSVQRLLSIMECYPKHPEYRVHRATLRYLATHLARVASRQAVNRMTAYNLALVFAPNLIQSNEDSPELFMADSKFKIWLLETIIKYHKWVFSPDLGLESGCFVPEDSDKVLLTDEALAEAMAASSSGTSQGLEFANQPGRSEGDVRPVLQEMLHAAALLPPPPSTSDLEVAEEPGPSLDKPTDVATVVEQALESSAVELQEIQQQHQQQQQLQQHQQRHRNRPVSQPGGENRSHNQERSLSAGRRREEHQVRDIDVITHRTAFSPYKEVPGSPEKPTLLIIPEDYCDVEREDSSPARMQHSLLAHSSITAPPSPRISSFNPSLNPSTDTTNKATSSSRWRPFHRQRRHSGGEAPESKSIMEMAVVEAGEEIYSISHLVAFRRVKSCRRRGDHCGEAREALSESPEPTTQASEEQPQKQSTPPSSSSETLSRVRHHSLRKWWFR
ncbi:Rho GTPase-activating protein 21-A [Echinococcus granulosus]|uniref:Rho GTPase-activating protein 21-A n=1 Tax=Echinococcus granulosus TaxID=6210 RepID=W6UF52_ECHGR|nr:Rho GTPase-activating protein 21-A [Echinococcus granulosus]EUB59743.1 Rho GTPase-activating protein 21-A [Echinococcus granulosus]